MKAADEARSEVSNAKLSTCTTYSVRRASMARLETSWNRFSIRGSKPMPAEKKITVFGPSMPINESKRPDRCVSVVVVRSRVSNSTSCASCASCSMQVASMERERHSRSNTSSMTIWLRCSKAVASSKFTRTVRTRDCLRPVIRPRPRTTSWMSSVNSTRCPGCGTATSATRSLVPRRSSSLAAAVIKGRPAPDGRLS